MLQLVRNELKADIRGLRSEQRAGFGQVDSRLEQVLSEVARVGILVEEQNSRNQIVFEGLGYFSAKSEMSCALKKFASSSRG